MHEALLHKPCCFPVSGFLFCGGCFGTARDKCRKALRDTGIERLILEMNSLFRLEPYSRGKV